MTGLYEAGEQYKNFLFLFITYKVDTVLLDSIPENFANIWQIKWNWIRSIKFDTVQIHSFKWCFWFLIQKSCYRGANVTRRNDFSSPFIFVIKERQEKHNIPMTVVVPRGATNEAGEKPYAEKFPISPRTIKVRPTLII